MKHCTVSLMSLNAVGVKIIFSLALEIGTFLMEVSLGNRKANITSRTRGPRSVILHRDNVLEPNGIYRCRI